MDVALNRRTGISTSRVRQRVRAKACRTVAVQYLSQHCSYFQRAVPKQKGYNNPPVPRTPRGSQRPHIGLVSLPEKHPSVAAHHMGEVLKLNVRVVFPVKPWVCQQLIRRWTLGRINRKHLFDYRLRFFRN